MFIQVLIYLLLLSIFLSEFLTNSGILPKIFSFIPEALSAIAMVVLIFEIARSKRFLLPINHTGMCIFLLTMIVFGVILNDLPSGVIFAGVRNYFRYMPFFLLPLVFIQTEKQLQLQTYFLLLLVILQTPIALYQRFILSWGHYTGDYVKGTVTDSGVLTIFLMCGISMITAFRLKGRLGWPLYFLLFMVFLIPTAINETKITFILLPIVVLSAVFFASTNSRKFFLLIRSSVLVVAVFAVIVPIYDSFVADYWGYGILDFFTMEGRLEQYLAPSTSGHSSEQWGRLDAMIMPFVTLAEYPSQMLLGLGMANVSDSALGDLFKGVYYSEYGEYPYGSVSLLIWEFGIIGTSAILYFLYALTRDIYSLAGGGDFTSTLASAFVSTMPAVIIGLFYSDLVIDNTVSYLFWYFSGVLLGYAELQRRARLMERLGSLEKDTAVSYAN